MTFIILFVSLALFVQSIFSVYLMLYSWEYPEKLEASKGPGKFLSPRISFTILLPARHEEAVIYDTIKSVWATNYPHKLLEVVVICHSDDAETIAESQRAIREIGSNCVRVETFSDMPINKPHGLNVGLRSTSNQVVTVFDAEDDIDADIFNVINTVMLKEQVGIIQAGVQLMNFRDHWFSIHNCMEYYFWFKSRLHYHARVGMIPLGGNTVFIRRDLLTQVGGWDERCLTEDAEIGLRLSTLGEPIRVIYDMQHATREETPSDLGSFIRQRTRWQQGFLQVLGKGVWLKLPRFDQRLLAFYTLVYPILQAILTLLWIPAVLAVFWLKMPAWMALLSFLPLYSLIFQFLTTVVGAFVFTREYGMKFPLLMPIGMAVTFLPYQWLLGISSLRAVFRQLFRMNNWEKTDHVGAHRHAEIAQAVERAIERVSTLALANAVSQANTLDLEGDTLENTELVAIVGEQTVPLPSPVRPHADESTRHYPVVRENTARSRAAVDIEDTETSEYPTIQKHATESRTSSSVGTDEDFEEENTAPRPAIRKGGTKSSSPTKPKKDSLSSSPVKAENGTKSSSPTKSKKDGGVSHPAKAENSSGNGSSSSADLKKGLNVPLPVKSAHSSSIPSGMPTLSGWKRSVATLPAVPEPESSTAAADEQENTSDDHDLSNAAAAS